MKNMLSISLFNENSVVYFNASYLYHFFIIQIIIIIISVMLIFTDFTTYVPTKHIYLEYELFFCHFLDSLA